MTLEGLDVRSEKRLHHVVSCRANDLLGFIVRRLVNGLHRPRGSDTGKDQTKQKDCGRRKSLFSHMQESTIRDPWTRLNGCAPGFCAKARRSYAISTRRLHCRCGNSAGVECL